MLTFRVQIPSSSLNILPAHNHNTCALLHSQVGMNPNVAKILNTLSQKKVSAQAAGPSQGASSSAPALPSTTVLPNAITYSSLANSTERRFDLLPPKHSLGQDGNFGQDENFQRVCEFLQDSKVGKVGIYGMGGVGKTSLLERIHNEYLAFSDFDLIMWIPLHKDVDYQNIWKLIHDREMVDTWFYFPSSERFKRFFYSNFLDRITRLPRSRNATKLYNFLEGKKFALVMDNMWEYVDLGELGIPEPTEGNMCKVVFATRSEEVCRPMNPDAEIKVECLGRDDSWALFEKIVGERALTSDSSVRGIAQQVVEECDGLPLALMTVGRAMSSRCGRERWEDALAVLGSYPYKFKGIQRNLYRCLQFSYDALEDETIKQCFLYCSLFPDGFHINKDKLIQYWMGEGYLGESESLKNLRNRGSEIVGRLESVCLLECGSAGRVKMHDVVRDMALWIVSRYGQEEDRFFVHQMSRGLGRSVIEEKWSKAHKIFVKDLVDLPNRPACPNLSTLLFNGNIPQFTPEIQAVEDKDSLRYDGPRQLPTMQGLIDDLIENMPRLRVLELSSLPIPGMVSRLVALRYLSGSPTWYSETNVGSLNNLRFFHLTDYFRNENSCIIGLDQLTELRQLNLERCNLKTLPVEVGRLTNLESLVLCESIHKLPSSIEQLIELRELHAQDSRLESLPEEIGDLTKLEILILTESQIITLPGTIGKLVKLEHLNLSGTAIIELPSTVGGLVNLRHLNLEKANLRRLPAEVGGMTKLEHLNLSYTYIAELPSTVGQLVNLRHLNLKTTNLERLPAEVGGMTKLEDLNLCYTFITELPSTVGGLVNLRHLNLEKAKLRMLPAEVGGMTKLEDLNLRNTHIIELPSTVGGLVNLRHLNIENANLIRLPAEVGGMTKLEDLNLRNTDITELPSTVGQLVNLRYLNLRSTRLKTLPLEVGGMTKLKALNLRWSGMIELPSTMGGLVNLQNLNLRGTNLKTLPKELNDLANLKILI